jgi:leader peptidase (prepilin peptidase) / N-methyltransferase
MGWVWVLSAGLVGLAVGSGLATATHRRPAGLSATSCPTLPCCGAPIAPRDRVPVLSWVLLHGRCRQCRARLPLRDPAVEVLAAGLLVAAALRFGLSWTAAAEMALLAGLVCLAVIDLDRRLLPRLVLYPTATTVLILLVAGTVAEGQWTRLAVATACATGEFVFLHAINSMNPAGLGFGDVRLGALIGLGLGWLGWRYAVYGLLLAVVAATLTGLALVALGRAGPKTPLPFGVFLALGAAAAIFVPGL